MSRALIVLNGSADRAKAIHWISKAPTGTRVEFKASQRSLPQNDRMWAMLTDIQAHMQKAHGIKQNVNDWKCVFLSAWGKEVRFLPSLDGTGVVPIPLSSSDLTREEMTDFIEFIFAEGSKRGVVFHDPATPDNSAQAEPEAGAIQSSSETAKKASNNASPAPASAYSRASGGF